MLWERPLLSASIHSFHPVLDDLIKNGANTNAADFLVVATSTNSVVINEVRHHNQRLLERLSNWHTCT